MSTPSHFHPRRRGVKATSPQMTPLDTQNLPGFHKCGTFHSPQRVSSDICNPIVNYTFMPKRSSTSPDDLEELLNGAGVRRVTTILEQFDRTFAGESSAHLDASILSDQEVLPVPNFLLDNTAMDQDAMDVDAKPTVVEHHHTSDSGLGSSIGESNETRRSVSSRRSVATGVSAINKSFSSIGSRKENGHSLGRNAIRQIEERIIKPILAEKALKDFHPLVADVPHRIGTKDITNLRDLEKTLIFLAPDYSTSPELYLDFCERSIQCIHTTVEYLCERDQRLPTDRPYTNNYFLDLIEQVRRYAAILAATRRKEENGETLDEMDYSSEEKVTLRGGLSENGRPLEIVREKDGKVIPIPQGDMSDPTIVKAFGSAKRSLEDEEDEYDDDGALRSMARRRKSDKPGDVIHSCQSCGKDFKRPCDLTKHKKTHTRPFKCPESKCKYHEIGWPTEKECDRHYSDKHSALPPQFKCQYPECAYVSKRESNCKQHMEKSHGYVYNRTKSNGRKMPGDSTGQTPITPSTPFNNTPHSALLPTPNTPSLASPMFPMGDNYSMGFLSHQAAIPDFNTGYRRDSTTTTGTAPSYGSAISPEQAMMGDISPDQVLANTFGDAISPEEPNIDHSVFFGDGMHFPTADFGASAPQQQQPTPALSASYDTFHSAQSTRLDANQGIPHLSPNAQPDVTLFSPEMNDNSLRFDEGFDETFNSFAPPQSDFQLFDTGSNANFGGTQELFTDFNNMGAHFDGTAFDNNFTFDDVMHN